MKRLPTLFLLFALVFGACSVVNSDSTPSKLVGRWQWIQSSGGFTGEIITPDSAGVPSRQLNFRRNHTFYFYRADTLVSTGLYSLKENNGDTIIRYHSTDDSFPFDQRVEFTGRDTLILLDECADCYINVYIRD